MYDILFFASLFGGWIVLNMWVLPWLGIPTCMSGACRVPHATPDTPLNTADQAVHVGKSGHE